VCARHGHDLMGCKSPVRNPGTVYQGDCFKSTSRSKGDQVTVLLKEAERKSASQRTDKFVGNEFEQL